MRRLLTALAATVAFTLLAAPASAQTGCSYIAQGAVLTPAQWNFCFSSKQNTIGYIPVNKAGDTMLGRLTFAPSTLLSAGINIAPGVAPTSPNNGDVWVLTSGAASGLYARINGSTAEAVMDYTGTPTSAAKVLLGQTGGGWTSHAMTGDCVISAIGRMSCPSIGGVPIFTPTAYGAIGDGIADDTTAWQTLCSAVQAAGGGHVLSAANKNYLIYNTGQSIASAMCSLSGLNGLSIDQNGSNFTIGRTFPPNNLINVTNTGAGAGGVVQLTVASTTGFYTGDSVTVAGVGGTTEANGTFIVTVPDSTHINLNATTFAHAYTSGGTALQNDSVLYLLLNNNNNHVFIKDWGYTQAHPITIPITTFSGTIGIFIGASGGGGGDYTLINPNGRGGLAPVRCGGNSTDAMSASTHRLAIIGGYSIAQTYGLNFADNCSDVTVRNFYTDGVERSYFVYGVTNQDISIITRNALANDVLIAGSSNTQNVQSVGAGAGGLVNVQVASTTGMTTGDTAIISGVTGTTEANGTFVITVISSTNFNLQGTTFLNAYTGGGIVTDTTAIRPTSDIALRYQVLPRTSGVAGTSYLTLNMIGSGGGSYPKFSNIKANLDMDYAGETVSVPPAVLFSKGGTAAVNLSLSNVEISGNVKNVPTSSAVLVDLGLAAHAPWSSETFTNISFENFVVSGATGVGFHVDYAAFPNSVLGGLSLRNVLFSGSLNEDNTGNVLGHRVAINATFGNGTFAFLPSWGGTGLMQPAAHSIMIAEGAAAFNLLTLTDGQLMIGATGNDPTARTVSGDATLSSTGVLTITSNAVTYSKFQQVAASSLVGNPTGSLANASGITLGATLLFSGSALQTAALSSDVTTPANSFVTTIAANVVTNAKFRQSAALSVVGNASNATANVADIVASSDNQILRRSGTAIGFGSIDLSQSAAVGSSILLGVNGGTGQASFAVGDILYASSTTALSRLADVATGNALISGGVGVAPSYGKIGLTTHVSGTLAETNGGTNQATYTTGDLLQATASNTLGKLASVATGNALISGGVGTASSWGKVGLTTHVSGILAEANGGTNQSTYTQGDLLYASAANTLAKLAKNTTATRYLANTGTSNNPNWDQINLANGVTGFLPTANGGCGAACGTASTQNTGTSGANLPFLNGTNIWSGVNTFSLNAASLPTAITGTVLRVANADSTGSVIGIEGFAAIPQLYGRASNGTAASPTATTSGQFLVLVGAYGRGATAYGTAFSGFGVVASQAWTDSNQGTDVVFNGVNTNASTNQELFRMLGTGVMKYSNTASFSANGAVATVLGSIGPTGSHTTVQKWLTVQDNGGTVLYIPTF